MPTDDGDNSKPFGTDPDDFHDMPSASLEPRKVSEKTRLKSEARYLRNRKRKAEAILRQRYHVADLRHQVELLEQDVESGFVPPSLPILNPR